jgi:hypothetical protein
VQVRILDFVWINDGKVHVVGSNLSPLGVNGGVVHVVGSNLSPLGVNGGVVHVVGSNSCHVTNFTIFGTQCLFT